MSPTKRIIVNTLAQYTRAILNIGLSLYSTRLVLEALNVDDYGIYSLVAGVVGILGYLTNALVVTTQRYLSFYHGYGDIISVRRIFANSLFIHAIVALSVGAILFCIRGMVMNGSTLNIAAERLQAASHVYDITVLMLLVTIITSPFKALLTARENIVYISIVEVVDGVMRLLLALTLLIIGGDKLIAYAIGMGGILFINLSAYMIYVFAQYEESRFRINRSTLDKPIIGKLLGFAGWTTYGMASSICQTQGLSVVFNHFFGTAINAAFGLAMQVNGAVRFVSTSVLNAMNPQIMKAEGNGDRQQMLTLAGKESKFSTALMMVLAIPIIIEMPDILDFWLRNKNVPEHTCLFCRAMLLAFLIDQTTLGLHAANQATGIIRNYSLLTYTPKILIVPISWGMLHCGMSVDSVMLLFVSVELAVAIVRIPFLHRTAGLSIRLYMHQVLIPLVPQLIISCISSLTFIALLHFHLHFLVTVPLSIISSIAALWAFTLNRDERQYSIRIITSRFHHDDQPK
ncbi:MAG: hypothetical protein IJV36_05460 [Prevotella sp.]|nr:hypothetical protein [Prevotella sp.]